MKYLLPNEEVRALCETRNGSLILTNRRVAVVNEKGQSGLNVERAIPYRSVLSLESTKADRFELSGKVLDMNGEDTGASKSFEIRAPKGNVTEFQSSMKVCSDVIEEIRNTETQSHDLTYLREMPETLTRNAILDLNTVLRDQPVSDNLVYEALQFLGDEAFIIEESLREGSNRENGVLFAAGRKGYYWIQGKIRGRFMSNVIVDTVEWTNFKHLKYQWHKKKAAINATYSLVKGGDLVKKEYLWRPPATDDTRKYPWLLQERNGPWILTDIISKYSA